jgi:hypothetical protein
MGLYAIIISIILYLVIAFDNYRQKDYPHASMWFFYALANCSLLYYELAKKGFFQDS